MISKRQLTEKQWNFFWKHAGIAFFILTGLILINAGIKGIFGVVWACPITEAQVLLSVPVFYIAIINSKIRPPMFSMKFNIAVVTILTIVLGIIIHVGNNDKVFKIIENGMISKTVDGLFPIMFVDLLFIVDLFSQTYEKTKMFS